MIPRRAHTACPQIDDRGKTVRLCLTMRRAPKYNQVIMKNTENLKLEKIESFKINHLKLKSGLYVSRRDRCGDVTVTTFDMRLTAPNAEPVVDVPALHTIEHLAATFLRNGEHKDKIVYFGPMGCRTGCYLVMFGELEPEDMFETVVGLCDHILAFDGDIPGATPAECGNYREQNLDEAKHYIARYRKELIEHKRFVYTE